MKFRFLQLSALLMVFLLLGNVKVLKADEGMWLPFLVKRLNYADMQKHGLKLTAEEIYSANHSSLKDAVIQLGNGCTGEIISPNGLILTNHHCGFSNIQAHSTIEHDYLTDGFWAMTMEEELPNPGFFVKFLINIEDVSQRVLKGVKDDMSYKARQEKIANNILEIQGDATEGNHYEAVIKPFFGGNEYYMFIMERYDDVRLVGAPPSSIGKFGGDTDNWMWPRHTGDFSMFRVYTAPDGSPAKYAKENIPMKPKHYLPVSVKGVQKNDFAMIMGYPGRTDRYLSSYGVNYNLKNVYPTRIEIRRKKLDIMSEDMKSDPKVRIQYASKYARISNYWKNFIGMSRGLKRLNIADQKKATEDRMKIWINEFPSRMEKYGKILTQLETSFNEMGNYSAERYYYYEAYRSGAEAPQMAMRIQPFIQELSKENPDAKKLESFKKHILKNGETFYKDFNFATDKKLFAAMMAMYYKNVPHNQLPDYFLELAKKYKQDFNKMAEALYAKTDFADKEKFTAFIQEPDLKKLKKDKLYLLSKAFAEKHRMVAKEYAKISQRVQTANRLYIDALRKMDSKKSFYPDANFTMRLTYGNVLDYSPEDGVLFRHFTTMKGIMEKEDPNNDEFIVPDKLKEIYNTKDFGPYGEENTQKVCFLTNNDITGGNSGSPVIGAHGELIGLAFDGNWEAMSGDIAFEPELQRTISVDIRYVLLIIDKYAGATNLIKEMTLVGADKK